MLANFSVLPPEINSLLMFSGAGSGPMLEAATHLQHVAVGLAAPRRVSYSMQDTHPSTSVPSKAIWRSRM
jgi:hypothetical protein